MACQDCNDLEQILDDGLGSCFSDFRHNVSIALDAINDIICDCNNCTVDVPVGTHPRDFVEVGWGGIDNLPSYERCPRLSVNMGCDMWEAPNKPLDCDMLIDGTCWQLICHDCGTGGGADTDDQTAVEVPYTPSDPSDWIDPDPTNVQQALDALANLYAAGAQVYASVSAPFTNAVTFVSADGTVMPFNTIDAQSQPGMWDPAVNQIIVPLTGLYRVNLIATLRYETVGGVGVGAIDAWVAVNGIPGSTAVWFSQMGQTPTIFFEASPNESNGIAVVQTSQRLMNLNAGDRLDVRYYERSSGSGAPGTIYGWRSRQLSIQKVG